MLVLDTDTIDTEIITDPQSGDVHGELLAQLFVGQLRGLVLPGEENHAPVAQPAPDSGRLLLADGQHLGIERALGQPLFVDP